VHVVADIDQVLPALAYEKVVVDEGLRIHRRLLHTLLTHDYTVGVQFGETLVRPQETGFDVFGMYILKLRWH